VGLCKTDKGKVLARHADGDRATAHMATYDPKVYNPSIGRPLHFFGFRFKNRIDRPPPGFRFILKPGALRDEWDNPFVNRTGHGNTPDDRILIDDPESGSGEQKLPGQHMTGGEKNKGKLT
jgi:hypothetical protein